MLVRYHFHAFYLLPSYNFSPHISLDTLLAKITPPSRPISNSLIPPLLYQTIVLSAVFKIHLCQIY